jgi:palmitoyl-protein thioesterase
MGKILMPVYLIPGMGDFCRNPISMFPLMEQIKQKVGNKVTCIDPSPALRSYLGSFSGMIDNACNILKKKEADLKDGFIIMGLSQGGLIARGVVQKCDMGKYAKRLITLGGTHQGVAQLPNTPDNNSIENFINGLVEKVVYSTLVQKVFGPAGYYHAISDDGVSYKASGSILTELNNINNDHPEYVDRLAQLDKMVLVQFDQDSMVIPKESAHFGFYTNHKKNEVMSYNDSRMDDNLGLKKLKSKIVLDHIDGEHLQFSMTDLERVAFPYFT